MRNNIITKTDSYKMCHWNMYPDNTEYVYSYFESRKGAKFEKTVFFGLQYFLDEYLAGQVVTREKIEWAAKLSKAHFGNDSYFNRAMWEHILKKHDGKLPLEIRAVPEGTPVTVSNVLMTVVNTDPKCAALTNYVETLLSQIWAPCTVATLSYEIMRLLKKFRDETGNQDFIKFGLHDFGFRGVSSAESAGIEGAGHLLNFLGTDTVQAIETAVDYYDASLTGLAYSVAATEHSIMTSMGKEGEAKLFGDLLKKYPEGILSVVIDSYDYRNFVNNIAQQYKNEILNRNGKVVFRPDSGDPDAVTLEVFKSLEKVFGTTRNEKGYKELNPKVGVLWGDGIDYVGIRSILMTLRNNGYSTNPMVLGMGGGLLQKINRDTQRFAFKSSAQCRDGIWYDIFKNPIDHTKASKKGILALMKNDAGEFVTTTPQIAHDRDMLVTVFKNGEFIKTYSFDEIRKNTGNW